MAEAKILTPDLPPESTYPVQLTLTRFEAEVLATLTMKSVLWGDEQFASAARKIFSALSENNIRQAPYRPKERLTEGNRTWETVS